MTAPPRHLVLWLPDWPVRAALGAPPGDEPVAVVQANTVIACSASARAQGVRRGQRRRLAQTRSPGLRILPADPLQEQRMFVPVLRLLEELVPGIQPLRPGLVALRARGAARYYGGEEQAALHLIDTLAEHTHPGSRAGVADGLFTAEQAARLADPVRVVEPGGSRAFLAPLPVQALADEQITALLIKLGVRTLAELAALEVSHVRDRLGERGVRLHDLAAGADSRPLTPQAPEPQLAREIVFDAPLAQAEQVAFAVRQTADAVTAGLAELSQVCTEVRIDLTDDDGGVSSRVWMHPTSFEASDLVDRVRWQLESMAGALADTERAGAGILEVRITPTRVDDSAHHQPGLFGQGPEQRLHHAVSRVQALLGHRGVVTPQITGGRRLAERQLFQPWGDKTPHERDAGLPWPGSLPPPHPSEVFAPPVPARVTAADGTSPTVDERGVLSAPPARIEDVAVLGWAGPWPLRERAWDAERARTAQRFQIVDESQRAWLALWEDGAWWIEGRYR
ncbi:DNA polymerase Y family protein [Microbacterium sp. YMB-B2]|uniref:DNA polymerase Y family protein n=1 Tax=Microbacterium tenebrionis TaxID=2830665 RepID=A0A9X1S1B3_9MICO|nr:DNA polymerase Y family protein [Microbacterium tenebrionis]MCC2029683.1 DNA polymerase Y family protein [Microbacterium tenebrionis]